MPATSPTPWHAERTRIGHWRIADADGTVFVPAVLGGPGGGAEANARLLAAAGDLEPAARLALGELTAHGLGGGEAACGLRRALGVVEGWYG